MQNIIMHEQTCGAGTQLFTCRQGAWDRKPGSVFCRHAQASGMPITCGLVVLELGHKRLEQSAGGLAVHSGLHGSAPQIAGGQQVTEAA